MTPLQLLAYHVLTNALSFDWSVQGFGMLRLYIANVGRLHIWDEALQYPGVSKIHNHSWDLSSTVIVGQITNLRYRICDGPESTHPDKFPDNLYAKPHSGKRMITGYQCNDVQQLPVTYLEPGAGECYYPGDTYSQKATEVHNTFYTDGTVTLMARKEDENGQADIYWPLGTEWGTAKPRPATKAEIIRSVAKALAHFDGMV